MTDGKKIVLIVEDEALLRMAFADALMDAGYEVIEAGSALEAVAILGLGSGIDAMVTDVDMPGALNGLHLATLAHRVFADMAIAVTSGRHEVRTLIPEDAGFFPKPCPLAHIVNYVDSRVAMKSSVSARLAG